MKQWLVQLRTLTAVNFFGYFREPAIIFWALIFPAGIAGVLGVAFQADPPEIPIALVPGSTYTELQVSPNSTSESSIPEGDTLAKEGTAFSAPATELQKWKYLLEAASKRSEGNSGDLKILLMEESQARLALKRGQIFLYAKVHFSTEQFMTGLAQNGRPHPRGEFPIRENRMPGESDGIQKSKANLEGSVEAHYDPRNPEARLSVLALQQALSRIRLEPELASVLEQKDVIDSRHPDSVIRSVEMESVGGRYIDFLIPGLLAVGIMNSCMWGVGYALIEFRVRKLMRRMAASPMYKSAFLASHFVARMAFTISEALILFGFAHLLFDVSIQGSLVGLLLLFFSGNVAWSGIGILCSSRGRSMHTANGIVNAVTLPLTMLSGIFFSYQNFPEWSQAIIQWLPLTVLADATRAIFIEGAGLSVILLPCGILIATGLITASVGLKIYRWH